jgi:hypothetical protein
MKTFCFLYKLTIQNIEEFLLRKHCKEGASVAIQLLTHVFDKFSEKIKKIAKKTMKTLKNVFLIYLHRFQHFQRHLRRI